MSNDQWIAAYLLRHPEAQDTVEGIAEWWILESRIHAAMGEVQQALANLAGQGFVVPTRQADGRILYRMDPSRREDLLHWLAQFRAEGTALPAPPSQKK